MTVTSLLPPTESFEDFLESTEAGLKSSEENKQIALQYILFGTAGFTIVDK